MSNHFEIFQLPQKFSLDENALEQKYFEFQKQFHPDKAGLDEIERSIAINNAYAVLKNPLKRAIHILQLNGIDLENDSKATKPDFATLEQVLEIQEKLPNLSMEEISILRKNLVKEIKSLIADAAVNLENKDFSTASQYLIKAKYFDKIVQDLKK